jgi:hypothetical protein
MDDISPSNTWHNTFDFEFLEANKVEPELAEEQVQPLVIEEARALTNLVLLETFRSIASEAARLARVWMQAEFSHHKSECKQGTGK